MKRSISNTTGLLAALVVIDPWGSGGIENQRNPSFLDQVAELQRQGLSQVEIARGFGMSTTQLRAEKSMAKNAQKQANINMAQRLRDKGMSHKAIAERMGLAGESSVRALLAPGAADNADLLMKTANVLRDQVNEKKFLDIGTGVELQLGVSDTRLKTAVEILRKEGYEVRTFKAPQLGTGHETTYRVLCPPGTTQKEAWQNRHELRQITEFSNDNGRTFFGILPPLSVNPNRLSIRYKEDGGDKEDGIIYVRPDVEDLSLGGSRYAQVRIAVDGGHYIKGMAMYRDDLPPGVDLVFNTNKTKEEAPTLDKVLKQQTDDPDNPFGSYIRRQILVKDADGKDKVTSAMNLVNEEGNWEDWSDHLASQVLSKQSSKLASAQLKKRYEDMSAQFDEISKMTNPAVRRKLLKEFSDNADAAAVHLKAASLPKQAWHVILPINSLTPTQIYAPNYKDGERVALIRYPHGGTFEIPDLIVNNNNRQAKRLLGNARDAVGIHSSVAERLSGADFDGDTVLVIPNNSGKIKITPALEGLKNFDPRTQYKEYPGMKIMANTQTEMGKISNLITDMTIKRADSVDIAKAVRHSMVVIDAEKHRLNYKQSELDNNIAELKRRYQGQEDNKKGAATLISRAKSPVYVLDRKERRASQGGPIDPVTGKKVYEPTGKINSRTGEPKTIRSRKLIEADDAYELSSGTIIESVYADHSNRMKKLANQARLELLNTPKVKYSKSAKQVFSSQVESLNNKLALAVRNRPYERQAQLLAAAVVSAKRKDNPNMDPDMIKKIKYQALTEMRTRVGAKPYKIEITPDEWLAIQAGAISESKLTQILDKADMDIVRDLATPRKEVLMSPAKTARAKRMLASGQYTRAEIANQLGVSLTTLDEATVAGS